PAAAGLRTGLRCASAMLSPAGDAGRLREIAATATGLAMAARGCDGWLSEHESKSLLRAAGVAVVDGLVVADEEDAVAALHSLGGCVAVKLSSPAVLHKSDLGA